MSLFLLCNILVTSRVISNTFLVYYVTGDNEFEGGYQFKETTSLDGCIPVTVLIYIKAHILKVFAMDTNSSSNWSNPIILSTHLVLHTSFSLVFFDSGHNSVMFFSNIC